MMSQPSISGCVSESDVQLSVTGHGSIHLAEGGVGVAGFGNFRHPDLPRLDQNRRDDHALELLNLWRHRGRGIACELSGDYVLVFWDIAARACIVAVDKFSTYPVFWSASGRRFAFASKPTEVPKLLGRSSEISLEAIFAYVYFHCIPGPLSICKDVSRLDRGNYLEWINGDALEHQAWRPAFNETHSFSFDDQKERFFGALSAGVSAGVTNAGSRKIGCFLSGGTDSSTIVGLLGKLTGAPSRTYSIVFDEPRYDEREYSRIAAKHFGTEHTEYVLSADEARTTLDAIKGTFVQPFGNSSAIPTYVCAKNAASDGVEVMFAGDGGDELYGGNTRYATAWLLGLYDKLPKGVRQGLLESLADTSVAASDFYPIRKFKGYVDQARIAMPDRLQGRYNLLNRFGSESVFSPAFRRNADGFDPAVLERKVWAESEGEALINRMLAYDFKFTLADNDLVKVTTMCQLAGVEACFPMLSNEVLSHSLQLPTNQKLRQMQLRYFFRNALRGYLPDTIVDKSKHGFGMPFGEWLFSVPDLSAMAEDALASLSNRNIIAREFVAELNARIRSTDAGYYGTFVWVLMMLELWLRESDFADWRLEQ